MPEFVMRHRDLPGQPIVVEAESEAAISSGTSPQEAAGWRLAKTKPENLPAEPTDDPDHTRDDPAPAGNHPKEH